MEHGLRAGWIGGLALLFLLACLAACLEPWPIGDPRPGMVRTDDDDADDDDATDDDDAADDDDAVDDDDTVDDDDVVDDDDAVDDDDTTPDPNDLDGDGYAPPEDCDETNPDINPGAYEIQCNHIDDDCDGTSDCDLCSEAVGILDLPAASEDWDTEDSVLGQYPWMQYGVTGPYYYETWSFYLPYLASAGIAVSSEEFDAYLEIRDSSCTLTHSDDNSGSGSGSWIVLTSLWGGQFYIVASSAGPLESGSYQVGVQNRN